MAATIANGAYVATDRRGDKNTKLVRIVADKSGIVQAADSAAGWQLAEYPETGYTVFVRLTADRTMARNWSYTLVNSVELADVDTVVVSGVIMAGVGSARPMGMVRSDNVEA